MIRKTLLILAASAAPLAAQDAPSTFELARTTPLTAGQWSYAATATGSDARFGSSFLIRCDRTVRRVSLRRPEVVSAGSMTITTDLGTRVLPVDGVAANTDPVLDAIAFSRGRFIVDGGGGVRLVLPASPEAARSVEDCRN